MIVFVKCLYVTLAFGLFKFNKLATFPREATAGKMSSTNFWRRIPTFWADLLT